MILGPGPNDPQQLPALFLVGSHNVSGETNRLPGVFVLTSGGGGMRMTDVRVIVELKSAGFVLNIFLSQLLSSSAQTDELNGKRTVLV